jgi:hypothetical protein
MEAHPIARRSAEVDAIDSMPLALEDLRQALRRRAEQLADTALAVEVFLAAGWKKGEIRPARQLTDDEWKVATRWLREELGGATSARRDRAPRPT